MTIKGKIKTVVFAAFLLGIVSCTERIDIELDSSYTRLSVEGYITTDTMAHYVRLTKTTDYYYSEPPPPVTGATVTIDDGENVITLNEIEEKPGYYYTSPDFYGISGHTYNLHVQLPEKINGIQDYYASAFLKPVYPIDSIQLVYNSQWNGWEVRIFAFEPPAEDYYAFGVLKNGVLLSDTINEMQFSDDRFINGSYINGGPVYFMHNEGDYVIHNGDVVTLMMCCVSKEFYEFAMELREETFDFRNPLFSGPPANISSNISDEATGFFTAYSVTYSSTVYRNQ